MRQCNVCRVEKPLEAFSFRNRTAGTRNHTCRECFATYRREHYRRNRAAYIERNVRNMRARRHALRERLWKYLLEHPCVDCGEADPLVLEFDHVDPSTKRGALYTLAHSAYGWDTILVELQRCEVRCANCHRRRTARQFGWPKLVLGDVHGV